MSETKPTIVTLCGSTRFGKAFATVMLDETLAGRIVLSIGCNMRSDAEIFADMADAERDEVKRNLDELHKRKIDMSDEILVLNVGGYIGDSTRSEVAYAIELGKRVRWIDPERIPAEFAPPALPEAPALQLPLTFLQCGEGLSRAVGLDADAED